MLPRHPARDNVRRTAHPSCKPTKAHLRRCGGSSAEPAAGGLRKFAMIHVPSTLPDVRDLRHLCGAGAGVRRTGGKRTGNRRKGKRLRTGRSRALSQTPKRCTRALTPCTRVRRRYHCARVVAGTHGGDVHDAHKVWLRLEQRAPARPRRRLWRARGCGAGGAPHGRGSDQGAHTRPSAVPPHARRARCAPAARRRVCVVCAAAR